MEAGTAASHSTGSKTIADLMVCAAEQFADRVAVRQSGAGVVNGEPAHALCYPNQYGNTLGFRGD